MKPDPSKPLKNSRHEAFVLEWAKGGTVTEAARAAGYSPESARKQGSVLGTKVDISDRKAWLQSQTAAATVLTLLRKREILCKIAEKGEDKDKIAAIRADNDLSGDGEEAGANAAIAKSLAQQIAAIRAKRKTA